MTSRLHKKRLREKALLKKVAVKSGARRRAYAETIAFGAACPGCHACVCVDVHEDGGVCGKKKDNILAYMGITIAVLPPHVRVSPIDADCFINESLRLKRPLTIQESARILTGKESS